MIYLVGFLAALALLLLGAFGWIRWFRVFDGPDGERYRRRAMQGPYAMQVDAHDEPGSRYSRSHPRHQAR